jgi:hypothetical protein
MQVYKATPKLRVMYMHILPGNTRPRTVEAKSALAILQVTSDPKMNMNIV